MDPFRRSERRVFGNNSPGVSRSDFHAEELPFHPSVDQPDTILTWTAELKRRFPHLFLCPIRILNRHRTTGANARYNRTKNLGTISFGPVAKRWVILHELAHVLSAARGAQPGHGPKWAEAYLELVLAVFGQSDHDRLHGHFLLAGYSLI